MSVVYLRVECYQKNALWSKEAFLVGRRGVLRVGKPFALFGAVILNIANVYLGLHTVKSVFGGNH